MKFISIVLFSLFTIAAGARSENPDFHAIQQILNYYNGTAHHDMHGGQYHEATVREGLYSGRGRERFTPTAVRHTFTEGEVTFQAVDLNREGGIFTYVRKLERQAVNYVHQLPNEAASHESAQLVTRYGRDARNEIMEYLLKSVRASDERRLRPLLSSSVPHPEVKLAQVIFYDTGSEVIGDEYVVLYNWDYSWAYVIHWRYTHS